jgi:hypothetical protein
VTLEIRNATQSHAFIATQSIGNPKCRFSASCNFAQLLSPSGTNL